jgi:hypothetical protein
MSIVSDQGYAIDFTEVNTMKALSDFVLKLRRFPIAGGCAFLTASASLRQDQLRRDFSVIVVLATLGVALSACVTALGMHFLALAVARRTGVWRAHRRDRPGFGHRNFR